MAEFTGRISSIAISYSTGKPLLTLECDEHPQTLEEMITDLRAAESLTIKIGKFRKKRSLDANAYFHVLVNAIAAKLKSSDEEVKRDLVRSYGTLAKDESGSLIGAIVPADQDITAFYPYTRNYKTEYVNGRECNCYLFYKRTRDLDSSEMARLIDGTIQEAQALGIQTDTPEQIAKMKSLWGGN